MVLLARLFPDPFHPMSPVLLEDPATVYTNNPRLLDISRMVLRDDAKALAAALRSDPTAVQVMGNHNVGLLMLAVANLRVESARQLLRAGADPFFPTSEISSLANPALFALELYKPDIFSVLLEEGMDPNGGLEGEGASLLKSSLFKPDDRRLRQLIATPGINLNLADRVDKTPLAVAIASGQYDRAILLLQAGANPRLGNINKLGELLSPLHAAKPGSEEDKTKQELIRRLQATGMTETTPTRGRPLAAHGNAVGLIRDQTMKPL